LPISKIKDLLKNDIKDTILAWQKGRNVDRQCYRIVGPAGVGKTAICHQIAAELTEDLFGEHNKKNPKELKTFNIIMVKSPVLCRDDFIIPFPAKSMGGEEFSFKMLYSDFVPKEKNSFGIFVIDEFSRGDHQLQQLLWQIQNEYAVHRFHFPKGWFVISVDNPDDSQYTLDTMEDAAGIRRQLHVYTEVNAIDFLNYAIAKDFHPLVIEFVQAHPEYVYDFQAQKIGSVYANPASWEKLSDHIWKMQLARDGLNMDEIEVKASGLLNTNMTALFIEFARGVKTINPRDVFYKYQEVEKKIKELLKENDNAKLGELMTGFCTFMTTSMPKYEEQHLVNIEKFLLIMPVDTAALFISQIDSFDRNNPAFKYMTQIHLTLLKKSKNYKVNFYDKIVKAGEGSLPS
jgi:DNA polymerase III delta prime subunit